MDTSDVAGKVQRRFLVVAMSVEHLPVARKVLPAFGGGYLVVQL
jgi:hypothetical protein